MAATRQPSTADVLRLGSRIAGIKAKTPPKVWKAFVANAHTRGFTVEGALSGQPDALKARTHAALAAQAASTVNQSYAPSIAAIDSQEARVQNLDTKRKADDALYRTWLTTQTDKLNTQAKAADATLAAATSGVQQNTQDAWFNAQAQARATAAATPGNVSDPNQSTALNFAAPAAAGDARVAAAVTQGASQRDAAAASSTLAGAALTGQARAAEAEHAGQTSQALQGIIDSRTKLGIAKSGDRVKEFARLLDQEISKANNAANLDVAAQKLGVDQNRIDASVLNATAGRKLTAKDAAASRRLERARLNLAKGKADLNGDGVVDVKDYKLKKQVDNATKNAAKPGAKPPTASQIKNSQTVFQTVETARQLLVSLNANHPKDKNGKPRSIRTIMLNKGYSDPVITLAEGLRRSGGSLTPGQRQLALNLGILHPYNVWARAITGPH